MYPNDVDRPTQMFIPILENLDISETQAANLATYDLIGRPGNLFSYLGAKSRSFNLKFNITLPNVLEYMLSEGFSDHFKLDFTRYNRNKLKDKEAFKKILGEGGTSVHATESTSLSNKIDFYGKARSYYYALKGVKGDTKPAGNFFDSSIGFVLNNLLGSTPPPKQKGVSDAVNIIILWVAVIRSLVLNNTQNTSLGPPCVYINHGTMYKNIPCVCSNVSIKINNNVGFDLISFTPRQIEVNLTLMENRTGNFKKYEPFKLMEGENIAGWEAVLDYGTTDPYNDQFGLEDFMKNEIRLDEANKANNRLLESAINPDFNI